MTAEERLAAQAQELDGLLQELAAERDKLAALRRKYEADLMLLRPYVAALQRGAYITVENAPPTTRRYSPDEFKALTDYSPRP